MAAKPKQLGFKIDKYSINPFVQAYRVWAEIVSVYTKAYLTVKTDKLIAISALAWYLEVNCGESLTYLAGLWDKNLTAQLLWKGFGGAFENTIQEKWRAPSWSWASIDGAIEMPELIQCCKGGDPFVEIKDACVDLLSQDRFGPLTGGRLLVCGRLASIMVCSCMEDVVESGWRNPKPVYKILINMDCYINTGAMAFPNSDYENGAWVQGVFHDLYFMPFRKRPRITYEWGIDFNLEGLILKRVNGTMNRFMRWGLGRVNDTIDGDIFDEAYKEFEVHCEANGFIWQKGSDSDFIRYEVTLV